MMTTRSLPEKEDLIQIQEEIKELRKEIKELKELITTMIISQTVQPQPTYPSSDDQVFYDYKTADKYWFKEPLYTITC